jgi:hypothetical protein
VTLRAVGSRTGRAVGLGAVCLLATACFDPLIEDPGNTNSVLPAPPGVDNPTGLPGPTASTTAPNPPVNPVEPVSPGTATPPNVTPSPTTPGVTPTPVTPGGSADAGVAVPDETEDAQMQTSDGGLDAGLDLGSSSEAMTELGLDAGEEGGAP